MSGVYSQPRPTVISSSEIIRAFESFGGTNTPEQNYFSGLRRANQIVKFAEPAYTWRIEASYPHPQVGSVYVDRVDNLILPKPLRIETSWELLDTYVILISFARVQCSGFVILN